MRTRLFVSGLALGAALRIAALPLPGTEDVLAWKVWSFAASEHVTGVYGIGGEPPIRGVVKWRDVETTVNYPPVAMYHFALVGQLYRLARPDYPDGLLLLSFVKLPVLVAEALLAWVLFWAVRTTTGSTDKARWAALAWWLNPATLLLGASLGYVDALCLLPASGALVAAAVGRPGWAGVLLAAAVWTKPQAVYVVPFACLAAWQSRGWRGLAWTTGAGTVVSVLVLLPYAVAGALPNMWLAFGSFWARRNTTSAQAANLWWVVNYVVRVMGAARTTGLEDAVFIRVPRPLAVTSFQDLTGWNPRPWTTAAVLGLFAWAAWTIRRNATLALYAAGAAFTVHAVFAIQVGAHENHQALEVPLLALAAACLPRLRPLFYLVSAIVALNLNVFYGVSRGWGWAVPRSLTLIDFSVLLAVVNGCALVWFGRLLARAAADAPTLDAPPVAGTRLGRYDKAQEIRR